jgi:hypothetical protein
MFQFFISFHLQQIHKSKNNNAREKTRAISSTPNISMFKFFISLLKLQLHFRWIKKIKKITTNIAHLQLHFRLMKKIRVHFSITGVENNAIEYKN